VKFVNIGSLIFFFCQKGLSRHGGRHYRWSRPPPNRFLFFFFKKKKQSRHGRQQF